MSTKAATNSTVQVEQVTSIDAQNVVRSVGATSVRPRSWPWVMLGGVLLLFSYGANNIALAAWLAPVFLLRFVRLHRPRLWLPLVYLLALGASAFQLRGMVPIPGIGYAIFLVINAIPFVIPYLIDRWLVPRIGGVAGTLVFPSACVTLEYLNSLGPYGSWGAVAYSQYGNLPLLQILSITGLWGIAFLMAWFASAANLLWEEGWSSIRARAGAYACGITIMAVLLLGGARLALFPASAKTVRIASLSKRPVVPSANDASWQRLLQNQPTADDLANMRAWGRAVDDDLLARAELEAQAGAKIVFWGEANAPLFKDEEAAFVGRGSELASRYQIYLGMAVGVWNTGKNPPLENKLILIKPDGQVAWQYNKLRPVPGPEAAMQIRGDGRLHALDTPFGRLSSVICFDADFPRVLAQAGTLGADIILDPSNDWRAIDPWHTQMASFRVIEQGVNLIRQTSNGLSAAYDYEGHRLAAMDHYHTSDYVMISEVPTRGVRTFYSRCGDWFAWASLACLLMLAALALKKGTRHAA
ncbi:MAG TPA: nitrilase-related carbon-nitrogen hydrolase [Terriglobales bacterium]|nr:nitrilase-related carbon-nitrogen hydrolase [Terriglobales bacterium]